MKGDNIAERLLAYGASVLHTIPGLSSQAAGRHIARQLMRAGTAPGAHYEEARRSESSADFVHKLRLAAKEAGESVYWLRLAQKSTLLDCSVAPLIREGNELTAILSACIRTAKSRGSHQKQSEAETEQ